MKQTLLKAEDIRAMIEALVGPERTKNLDTAGFLKDYCEIGVFLTDGKRCEEELIVLNNLLAKKLSPKLDRKQLKKQLKPDKTTKEVDHRGVVSGCFTAWEAMQGLNNIDSAMSGEPVGPPKLTHVVQAPDFIQYLFKGGYHWKDPGVGVTHGEFTHRIQWFMVTHRNWRQKFLVKTPRQLFLQFGESDCQRLVDGPGKKTVWDILFDDTKELDCRTPNFLHRWLKDEPQLNDKRFAVLASLIAGRSQKRQNDKAIETYQGTVHGRKDAGAVLVAKGVGKPIVWTQPRNAEAKVLWTAADFN